MNRIFSGMQPTRQLHLGNYLGALRNWVALQDQFESIFCIVDLHALTLPQDPAVLLSNTREVTAAYIAAGIDPDRCIIFNQAAVAAHSELSWILSCHTPMGWLNRMTQFKEKAGKHRENAALGLYAYPVLMAADILVYKATHVPVGEDQKQHLELARDIAGAFNRHYGQDFFPLPEPQILGEATRVMSLRDGSKKMSKSDESDYSRINLTDDADTIALKVRKAKTDPEPLPEAVDDLEKRPEADNLVTIYSALAGISRSETLGQFAGQQFSAFKGNLVDLAVAKLAPISMEMNRLMSDVGEIDRILRHGADKANAIASANLSDIKDIIGLLRPLMPILVTGFERFGPNDLNPTALLMDRLAGREGVVAAVLPVEYHTSVRRFEALLDEHRPDAAVAFGLARSYDQIRVERAALNLDEATVPDNAGVLRRGLRIVEDGPVGYWSTLPVDRLIDALGAAGLPAAASGHAGGYVCNHLFYGVRHALELRGWPLPMGFVHVPPLPEQVAGEPGRTGLALSELERAAEIILSELAGGQGGTPSA